MRSRSVVSTLLVLTAGAAASVVTRRLASRRARLAAAPAVVTAPAAAPVVETVVTPAPERDAVVLPFTRPAVPTPAPAAPVRCGDTGGRTKAGAPCAARGTVGGRCHHHRLAA